MPALTRRREKNRRYRERNSRHRQRNCHLLAKHSLHREKSFRRRAKTRRLRVPRRLFKFLYTLIASHCNAHSDQSPSWTIAPTLFESTLALTLRDQDAFDRGVGAG